MSYTENEGKDEPERSLYDTDRNIRDTILDSPFTGKEVVKGTTLLKSKKASVHDYISNEMMKASLPSSLSFSVILFIKILQTQIYPEESSRGIITLILQLGEMEKPDKYRGVTINSSLSKVFNLLLNNRLLCLIND